MIMHIWEKYFLKEFFKLFFLFIFSFYGLYILIDFTSHSNGTHYYHTHFFWKELLLYYACEFVRRADVLIPFALLISSIRTLCMANVNNELIALLASGIKLKRLLRPFLIVGLMMTALMYINEQYLQPYANTEIKYLAHKHFLKKDKKKDVPSVQHLLIEDGSKLLYHSYNEPQSRFMDVYWVRSIDDIYHIKALDPNTDIPTGYYVDRLRRSLDDQSLHVTETHEVLPMNEMVFNKKTLRETITMPDDQSLSELWEKMPSRLGWLSDKQAQVVSVFYRKLVGPWLCLLAVIAPAPYCLRMTRNLPVFYIYALSIFVFVTLHLALDAAVVLGKRQVLAPELAIVPPLFFFICPMWLRYVLIK